MDDYSDDVPFWDHVDGKPILILPYALDSNDMKMWTTPGFTPADWLRYAVDTFDCLYAEGAAEPRMMSLGVHLRIIGRPGRIGYLERFVEHVRRHPRVWIATREAIAEHWAAAHPPVAAEARGLAGDRSRCERSPPEARASSEWTRSTPSPSTSRAPGIAICPPPPSARRRRSSRTRSASASRAARGRGWTSSSSCLGGWGAGDEASVFARRARLPAPSAALANAYQIHNSEFDCVHEGAVVHAMTAVMPAALAHAERRGGVRGEQLVAALALGVDVACHVGAASRAPLRFFRPGTAGGFGAAAAVGKLMGFDTATLVRAMGIGVRARCAARCRPTRKARPFSGCRSGFNARNAIVACDMAARGAPERGERPRGAVRLLPALRRGATTPRAITESLGRVWRVTELSHKPFPSGRATHGIVDGLLDLRRRVGFAAADVERVTRGRPSARATPRRPRRSSSGPSPATRGSAPATSGRARSCAARVDLDDFRPAALADEATHALARRFEMDVDDNPDPNALGPVTVAVRPARRRGATRSRSPRCTAAPPIR